MSDFFIDWQAHFMEPERIPYALFALLIAGIAGMITGPVAGNANPFLWLVTDRVFGRLGDRLDKPQRARGDLVFRGFLVTAAALFLGIAIGRLYEYTAAEFPLYGLSEAVLLASLVSVGAVWFVLLRLYFALEKQEIGKGAYYAIARSARLNLSLSDDYGITRAGMNYAAYSFDKAVVNPVFWYILGGLPVAVIYSTLAALSWRFGRYGHSKGFGAAPAALEKLMGFFPSLFAGLLIALAGLFTPTAGMMKGVFGILGMKNRSPYEEGGFPLSALSWSLKLALGGPFQDLAGRKIKNEWAGPEGATARNDHKHLRRALYIHVMAHLLFAASLGGAYMWSGVF